MTPRTGPPLRSSTREAEFQALRVAVAALLIQYDQSGLTGINWLTPYMDALRDALPDAA